MTDAIQAGPGTRYPPATAPTMYFVGVTTGGSSIGRVFPRWAESLGLPGGVVLQGVDCKVHDDPLVYRRIVETIKRDPLSVGAVVTTHKIDLLRASRDLFDELGPDAELLGEVSSIYKRHGRLIGGAIDRPASGLALEAFVPGDHWKRTGAEVLVLGAGGASTAVTSYLMGSIESDLRPARIVVTDRSALRLEEIRRVHDRLGRPVETEYRHTPEPRDNDALLNRLTPRSLVINATGLGKDAPGSPITGAASFPESGYAWDFNYRGELLFLDQARAQQDDRRLHVQDGWGYFIHGWTRGMAEVFDLDIPASGPQWNRLAEIASATRT